MPAFRPFSEDSRLIEMIDATVAREKINPRVLMSPETLPRDLQCIVAAVFCVKFAVFGRMLPPSIYEELREDLSALLMATLGPETLKNPSFKTAYAAARKDLKDAIEQQRAGE